MLGTHLTPVSSPVRSYAHKNINWCRLVAVALFVLPLVGLGIVAVSAVIALLTTGGISGQDKGNPLVWLCLAVGRDTTILFASWGVVWIGAVVFGTSACPRQKLQ